MKKVCSVEGCDLPYNAKDLCYLHYRRKQRGIPLDAPIKPRRYESVTHQIMANVIFQDGHMLWTGALNKGYGVVKLKGGTDEAHRVYWELVNGPLDPDLQLDHDPACPKNCILPAHLTPRTAQEHTSLGWERGEHGELVNKGRDCSVFDCSKPAEKTGLCNNHYQQKRKAS